MTRLFLVRHGETDWNVEGRAQGQTDTRLNDTGYLQAERVASRLSSVTFVAAYSSDLSRVVDTASPILRGRDVPLTTMPELREKNFGEWEGMTFDEIGSRYPEQHARLFSIDTDFAPPGGESDLQVFHRAGIVSERIYEACGDEEGNILVVSHGGMLYALIAYLLHLSAEEVWRFRLDNSGLSIISLYQDDGVVMELFNDTCHLRRGI